MTGQCPMCRAAWTPLLTAVPLQNISHAVCQTCSCVFSIGDSLQLVPPRQYAQHPPPIAIGSLLNLRGRSFEVAGFSSWTCSIEHGRDQYHDELRHEYTLLEPNSGRAALLVWCWNHWSLLDPASSAQWKEGGADGRDWTKAEHSGIVFKRHHGESFQPQSARGLQARPFHWNSPIFLQDFVSGPYGPGGKLALTGALAGTGNTIWIGGFLASSEIAAALGTDAPLPDLYRQSVATPADAPKPVVAGPMRKTSAFQASPLSNTLRALGLAAISMLVIMAIGAVAYYWDWRSKPAATSWVSCPADEARVDILGASQRTLVLDPHLPQGSLQFELTLLDRSGAEVARVADFLDMSAKRRTFSMPLPQSAVGVRLRCKLPVAVAGLKAWPVEVRLMHEP